MEKLNKGELEQQDNLAEKLDECREAREALVAAIEDFNIMMGECWADVENAEADFNEAVAAAREWAEIHELEYDDYELEESRLQQPVDLVMRTGLEYFDDQWDPVEDFNDQPDPVE